MTVDDPLAWVSSDAEDSDASTDPSEYIPNWRYVTKEEVEEEKLERKTAVLGYRRTLRDIGTSRSDYTETLDQEDSITAHQTAAQLLARHACDTSARLLGHQA